MTMTEDSKAITDDDFTKLLAMVRGLPDTYLGRVVTAGTEEQQSREQRRKDDAIAKIRALAGDAGIVVSIAGTRNKRARAKQRPRRDKQSA